MDPFAENIKLQRSAAWAISHLTEQSEEKTAPIVQPVYIVNDASSIVPQRLVGSYQKKIQILGDDSIIQMTQKIPLRHLNRLEVISGEFFSFQEGAKVLLDYAKSGGFNLIVASTHARFGSRSDALFPGSFVETILDQTEIPSLVVNPKWRMGHGVDRLVFPTDFSEESQVWFERAISLAQERKLKLTLFYKLDLPLSQSFETAVQVFPQLRDIFYQKVKKSQTEGKKWIEATKGKGVNVSLQLSSDLRKSYTVALQECTERYPGLLLLTPPLSTRFSHQVVRKMLGRSPFPILWVPSLLGTAGVSGLKRIA
jgi:nucleotide-binding universal stress UspA family protein